MTARPRHPSPPLQTNTTMSADWKAGDKAVCVADHIGTFKSGRPKPMSCYPNGLLKKGTIYLVSGVRPPLGLYIAGKPVLHFYEGYEKAWVMSRFRKVVTASERASISATNTTAQPKLV